MTPPTVPTAVVVALIIGAVIGVLVRVLFTRGQSPWSRETGQDAFLGVVLAVAWTVPIPGLSLLWPPFSFPAAIPAWQQGVLFAGIVWLFIELAKKALLMWAPKWFAKYTGQVDEAEPPKKG